MTYPNGATTSDSVNLGSNPSSPATENADGSGISRDLTDLEKTELPEQTAHTGHTEVGTAPEDIETTLIRLDVMARVIRWWLDWHSGRREREHLVTDDGTHIMGLPVPSWPSHGQLEAWIKAMDTAAAQLRALRR